MYKSKKFAIDKKKLFVMLYKYIAVTAGKAIEHEMNKLCKKFLCDFLNCQAIEINRNSIRGAIKKE